MQITNRIYRNQADFILAIVQPPSDWRPRSLEDVPPKSEILSRDVVASFEEAQDDLLRCNALAMQRDLGTWAVIQSPGAGL